MTKARENGDGGLILVGSSNFSAVSTITFSNLTAGSRYRIMFDAVSNTNNNWLIMVFREGSTDKTSAYYGGAGYANAIGGTGHYNGVQNGSLINLIKLTTASTELASGSIDLLIQSNGASARINGTAYASFERTSTYLNYENTGMSAVDGFKLYPASGNITGTIRLYKYR